ncbi:hypothetical protein MJM83_29545, partial [Salmonella enterica subsp. enterica serovar Montevideo]|nr:hypothetical protein [Salmonella enterica subsp. enterica serovar Montevideo]
PFMLSSLGYGFLWNNPAVGRVTFAQNVTEWEAQVSEQLDYWILFLQTGLRGRTAFFDAINLNAFRPVFQLAVAQRRALQRRGDH